MQLHSNTGSPIVLAGLTIPAGEDDPVEITLDQYMADETRRARINALALDGDIDVNEGASNFDDLPGAKFPVPTAGELENEEISVRMGARIYAKISIPGVLTVADSADSYVVPFDSKVVGVYSNLGTNVAGAALVHGVKKNGVDVFAGHVADRVTIEDGNNKSDENGPATGAAAYNAANQAALQCGRGDVLTLNVTAIGTTSGHHGSDLAAIVVLEASQVPETD